MNREYKSPVVEKVPLMAKEAVLYNCKCVGPQVDGPPSGWCSGWNHMSCETVGS